ncbi:MAG: hypothetical protein JRF50_03255 [Deltaproteobacteria bacterium]|nr:hypothetical protein [Deltaproteobacteria bacterium]
MARPKFYLIEDLEDIVRLEFNTKPEAVRKQAELCRLKPGGHLCLLDLDNNCLDDCKLSAHREDILFEVPAVVDKEYIFDPYAGRRLDTYLYDLGYEDIRRIIWKPLNID